MPRRCWVIINSGPAVSGPCPQEGPRLSTRPDGPRLRCPQWQGVVLSCPLVRYGIANQYASLSVTTRISSHLAPTPSRLRCGSMAQSPGFGFTLLRGICQDSGIERLAHSVTRLHLFQDQGVKLNQVSPELLTGLRPIGHGIANIGGCRCLFGARRLPHRRLAQGKRNHPHRRMATAPSLVLRLVPADGRAW